MKEPIVKWAFFMVCVICVTGGVGRWVDAAPGAGAGKACGEREQRMRLYIIGVFIIVVCCVLLSGYPKETANKEDAVTPVPCAEEPPTLEERNMSLGAAAASLRSTESRLLDKYEACLVLVRECVDSCCKEE